MEHGFKNTTKTQNLGNTKQSKIEKFLMKSFYVSDIQCFSGKKGKQK